MIGLRMMVVKVMGVKCAQIVNDGCGKWHPHGQEMGCILSFTCKRLLSSSSTTTPRLKREDIQYILHHSSFSPWKILIGPWDWKEHLSGKERYRSQNLPKHTSPAGAYELGIATSASRNLDSASVIPVYTGQADNVRGRLQSYGRDGAHLDKADLFSPVFNMGFPIVYRWAPMRSKEEAERREAELLGLYDYAWNKRNNGDRRPHHIHAILFHKQSLLPQIQLSTFFAITCSILLNFKTIKCSILRFFRPPK